MVISQHWGIFQTLFRSHPVGLIMDLIIETLGGYTPECQINVTSRLLIGENFVQPSRLLGTSQTNTLIEFQLIYSNISIFLPFFLFFFLC